MVIGLGFVEPEESKDAKSREPFEKCSTCKKRSRCGVINKGEHPDTCKVPFSCPVD